MTGADILKIVLERENINHNQLAVKLGLNRTQSLYDITDGKVKKISKKYAEKINSSFPEYRIDWLMTGKEPMLNLQEFEAVGGGRQTNQSEEIARLTEKIARLEKENSLQDDLIKMLKEKVVNFEHPVILEAKKEDMAI